ncbi:unnamed product [Ostreococcus tauri]|uniref:Unnamed product n=2 Tax=Ostreococcus tauri TaxID=70448 RepID=A0A096PBD9_OSTTA|nr:unnamed product [Ostreococcus tauri]CEG01902.1 unnamed product [Ostreococcus tauri]|eukprot:XP_022841236.1 unnamed product [Ostreococcus tauri]
MMPPRNCESDDVENPNDTRRNELTARETSLLGTRDVSLDNVRGVVVLFVIYFHYYECWNVNCRLHTTDAIPTHRSASTDWMRVALYMFQSLVIVSGLVRSHSKTLPLKDIGIYTSWFVFEMFVMHVFKVRGNSFGPAWFLLDVILGQIYVLFTRAFGMCRRDLVFFAFVLTVAAYVCFPDISYTRPFWEKFEGHLSPRSFAHTLIFVLSSSFSKEILRVREKVRTSLRVRLLLYVAVVFVWYQSIYTSGDHSCSILFTQERFSKWDRIMRERCQHNTWCYSLFQSLIVSTSIVLIAPSSQVPIISWMGKRSVLPYIAHMYFVHGSLKDLVDSTFGSIVPRFIIAVHATVPLLLNIVLSRFDFVLNQTKRRTTRGFEVSS